MVLVGGQTRQRKGETRGAQVGSQRSAGHGALIGCDTGGKVTPLSLSFLIYG